METREILVANTKTQKRSKITTDATTLGELKSALSAAGIDYSGMTFTEGISKTQLLDDATQLPRNVIYKGQATNNLVILLTNTKKNIASGLGSRQDAYSYVKRHGLQEVIKEKFGRNFTQVPTDKLWSVIDGNDWPLAESAKETSAENAPVKKSEFKEIKDKCSLSSLLVEEITGFIRTLALNNALSYDDVMTIISLTKSIATTIEAIDENDESYEEEEEEGVSTSDGSINDEDIDNMLDELNI